MTAPMRIPQGLGKRVGGGRPGPVQSQPKQSFMDWWDKIVAGREQSADPFGAEVAAQAQYGDPVGYKGRPDEWDTKDTWVIDEITPNHTTGDTLARLVSDTRGADGEYPDSVAPLGSFPAGAKEGDVLRDGVIDRAEGERRGEWGRQQLDRLNARPGVGDVQIPERAAGGGLGGRLTQKKRMERGGRGPDVLDELEPTGSPRMLMRKGSGWAPAPQDPEAAGIAQLRASGMSDDDLLRLNPYGEPPTPRRRQPPDFIKEKELDPKTSAALMLDPKTLAALMQTLNLGR